MAVDLFEHWGRGFEFRSTHERMFPILCVMLFCGPIPRPRSLSKYLMAS